jgi:hypothetical protein
MKKGLILVAVLAVLFGVYYFGDDHQLYIAFDRERAVWHEQCDSYIGKPATTPAAQECAQRLATLTAYANSKGW